MVFDKPLGRGGEFDQKFCGPYRAAQKVPTAIRAEAVKDGFGAIFAECAFERAAARILTIGWKIRIAAFAIGFQFQHEQILSVYCW